MTVGSTKSDAVALRVAGIYAGVSLLWILFSDRIVDSIALDRSAITELQTLKGWLFVLLSAIIIYLLVRYHLNRSLSATKALESREQRYEQLVRNAPMAIWEVDLSDLRCQLDLTIRSLSDDPRLALQSNTQLLNRLATLIRIHHLNQEAVTLLGASSMEEAIALSPSCVIDGANTMAREALIHLYRGATSAQWESRIRTAHNLVRSVLIRIAVAPEESPTWDRATVIMVDITERKDIENRLRDRERMLSEAQRLGNIGAYEWDMTNNKLEWTRETHHLHGTDPLHFTPTVEALWSSVVPEDIPAARRAVEEAMSRRAVSSCVKAEGEFRIRRPDGQVRNLLVRSEFIYDADGKPIRCIGVEQDVTERRQFANFLERYNNSLQRLVVVIQQLSFTYDVDSLAQLVSSAARLLVGADSAIFTICEGDKVRCVAEQAEKPIFNGMTIPVTLGVSGWSILNHQAVAIEDVARDPRVSPELYGSTGIASLAMVPIRQEDPLGAVGAYWKQPHAATPDELALLQALADAAAVALTNIRIYRDLDTARCYAEKKSEENLRLYEEAHREMAERKDAERHRLELEAQLRQSQKMEVVGILAGGIAHDFNNILTPLCGYADLAMEALPPGSEGRDEIEHILKAANRARDLIQQILTFSRRSDQVRESISLAGIAKETAKLLRSSLPQNIDIRCNISGDAHMVMADPAQLHQVVMNLCTNAYHAMRDHGGVLEITLDSAPTELTAGYPSLHDLSCLRLQVRDTGCGIDPAVLPHIFEPFFTTKEKGEGTGLGLAVVNSIITAHGGEIKTESRIGAGTTFTVFLPTVDAPHREDELKDRRLPKGNGERILVVDDEVAIVTMMRKVLTRLGYEVISFSDSVIALDGFSLSPHLFDLVIFDWNMPQINGRQLATAIRKIRNDIPLLLMTGLRHEISDHDLTAIDINACVAKPFTSYQISTAVHNLLQSEHPVTTAAKAD